MAKEQRRKGQIGKPKPIDLEPRIVRDEKRFRIRDLLDIEFSFDGVDTISVYDALPTQMDKLANIYANVSNVDVNVWPVEERLDFVNNLWDFCQKRGYQFPLQIKQVKPVAKPIDETPNSHAV